MLGLLGVALGGCAATLPYAPAQQPAGVTLSADYRLVADRLRVEIDTGGYRLEEAQILRPDGSGVPPQTVEHPSFRGGSGLGLGLGIGGGYSGGGGFGVGSGIGVGTGIGGGRGGGHTLAYFPLEQIGPAPWRLRIKVVGMQAVEIVLPAT